MSSTTQQDSGTEVATVAPTFNRSVIRSKAAYDGVSVTVTPEHVKAGRNQGHDAGTVLTGPQATAFLLRDSAETVAAQGASVMWDGAVFTHWVMAQALIGDAEGCEWKTQQDYAAALGYGKSYGTALKRLAIAAVDLKIDNGTPIWSFLSRKAGDARVGKVLNSETLSADDKVATLKGLADEFRQGTYRANVKAAPQTPTPELGNSEPGPESQGKGTPESNGAPTSIVGETIVQVFRRLETILPTLDRDESAALDDRVTAFLDTVRAHTASLAEQGKATPAAMPRKKAGK